RDRWTVTGTDGRGGLRVRGDTRSATLPAHYVRQHTELAYATTVHGVQGETVAHAHLVVGDSTGAASAYVGMTRGRVLNTAHLVGQGSAHLRGVLPAHPHTSAPRPRLAPSPRRPALGPARRMWTALHHRGRGPPVPGIDSAAHQYRSEPVSERDLPVYLSL